MNLHVTNDNYGFFPSQIAKRIRESEHCSNNLIVNLSEISHFRDEKITYIPETGAAFRSYIKKLPKLDKILFHPYNYSSYQFLTYLLKRFPDIKVYWICWSYELYKQPQFTHRLYEPFSANFIKNDIYIKDRLRKIVKTTIYSVLYFTRLRKNYFKGLIDSYKHIDYFCSLLPSDYDFLLSVSSNKAVRYVEFSYLSLDNIMPDLNSFKVSGNEIMIGHSALPDGNHYEIIQKLAAIDRNFNIFLPLAYGNNNYKTIIKKEALAVFRHITIQEEKLETNTYYRRLTKVGWAIINAKVQQGLGNILALIWMGTKLFLDENTSTYKDFKHWGINIFSVQSDLTKKQLTEKLTDKEIEHNRRIILERFNEKKVNQYWEPLLN